MFPFTLSGWITVRGVREPESFAPAVRERVIEMFEDAYAERVWREENGDIRFQAGLFRWRVSSWNILVPFGSGRVRVTPRKRSVVVSYRLNTLQLLGTVSVMLAFFAAVFFRPDNIDGWLRDMQWVLPLFFGWLFGANYLTGMIRFPFWLRAGLLRVRPYNPNAMSHSLRN
jgi:hypothetical protein